MEKKVTKLKWFISLQEEKNWLEEMACQGFLFEDITLGIFYTFRVGKPTKMIYEIDRFDLPKSPTLSEIQEKEIFMNLAEEMGWKEITHDEDMNYYFGREYVHGDVNELYTGEEMRQVHADKYRNKYQKQATGMFSWACVLGCLLPLTVLLKNSSNELVWIFLLPLVVFLAMGLMLLKAGESYGRELRMEASKWRELRQQKKEAKKYVRLFLTTKSLERFLQKQSRKGLHIVRMTGHSYYFEAGEPAEREYRIDTKAEVNSRRKLRKSQKFADSKDINDINQDWQIQSTKDAAESGMRFLCSCGNGQILYCGENGNTFSTKNRLLNARLFGFCMILLACFLSGYVVGYVSMYFR